MLLRQVSLFVGRVVKMQTRKQTAYRKSRKFGDIHGGRVRPRVPGGVFRRTHSLDPPAPGEEIPILIQENPSRKFFFPLDAIEARAALEALPRRDTEGITHIWLRRASQREFERGRLPLAEFVCGRGVRAIVLYPWPKDRRLCLGRSRPRGAIATAYSRFGGEFSRSCGWWYVEFSEPDLRRFYARYLIYHEIGHHIDWYRRHWSKANRKQTEDSAEQYAVQWSRTGRHVEGLYVDGPA